MNSGLRLASFWRRLGAFSIDFVLIMGFILVFYFLGFLLGRFLVAFYILFESLIFLTPWTYLIGLEGAYGQTLGKRWFNIRVLNKEGIKPGFLRTLVRNISRIIDMPLAFTIFFTKKKQRIGDMFAGTVVVNVK